MSTARIDNPDDIFATLSFKMKLSEWKQVRKTLRSNAAYTELKVIDEITELVDQIEQVFYTPK